MEKPNKIGLMLGLSGILGIGVFFLPAISQDPRYHDFSDTAEFFGIPNFWNVISNLGFIIVGIFGWSVARQNQGGLPELKTHYLAFFAGIFLTGLGSAYFHWHPNNETLVWDRLPMTVAFMSLFAIVIGEHMDVRAAQGLLWHLIVIGMASVGYWHWTETQARGDLRFYGLVQFLPLTIIPLTLVFVPSRFSTVRHLWWVILAYGVSKVLEYFDHPLFGLLGIGGHPLKHIVAALGAYGLCVGLRERILAQDPKLVIGR